jgi:hypothetical protein
MRDGAFVFCERPVHFARELRLEGRYVVATSEDTFIGSSQNQNGRKVLS